MAKYVIGLDNGGTTTKAAILIWTEYKCLPQARKPGHYTKTRLCGKRYGRAVAGKLQMRERCT